MRFLYFTMFLFLFFNIGLTVKAETVDLQKMIDTANGNKLVLKEGVYTANITINRPIELIAEGNVTIKPKNINEPIITIQHTNQVTIEGLKLETPNNAMLIKDAQNVYLSNLKIQNVHSGIEMYRAKNVEIKYSDIIGNEKHYGNKGNGIAVFNSSNILVEGSNFNKVQDGVYVETVNGITVRNNHVENSRYGTHFMYSENALAEGNVYTKNVTGLMVMMTNNIKLLKNEIFYQEGFNGTGITLYDVNGIDIDENDVAGNRVAISIQKTSDVNISLNKFQMNQTAIESIKSSKSNIATNNYFVGNLVNVRSDSIGMTLKGNYYDDYAGIDIDDDGIGDEPYIGLQSFGQWMVRKPVYQYYVEAPSVVILNAIDKVTNKSEQHLLVDKTPKTDFNTSYLKNSSMNFWQLVIGIMLVIGCLFVWKRSVIR